jgi:predicted nucleotidyltransferase
MIRLKHYLENKIGRSVDIVDKTMIKKNLRDRIISETVPV